MASVRTETLLTVGPDVAWLALRAWSEPHVRLVAGFLTDTVLDGSDRIVTLAAGTQARERLVSLDDDARRLVWSIVGGRYSHHNASAQIFAAPGGAARFVWNADLLPDELAAPTENLMRQGTAAVRMTLKGRTSSAA
jgi:hypothetical protein